MTRLSGFFLRFLFVQVGKEVSEEEAQEAARKVAIQLMGTMKSEPKAQRLCPCTLSHACLRCLCERSAGRTNVRQKCMMHCYAVGFCAKGLILSCTIGRQTWHCTACAHVNRKIIIVHFAPRFIACVLASRVMHFSNEKNN